MHGENSNGIKQQFNP